MKLELNRTVEEQSYEVIMEMGIEEKREEILAVLQLSQNGNITIERVNRELLDRHPESIHGVRILENMENPYGLIQKDPNSNRFILTDEGRYALDNSGNVFIPERGCYIVYTTEDPLFKERNLGYERISSASFSPHPSASYRRFQEFRRELDNNKDRRKKNRNGQNIDDEFINLPAWLIKDRKRDIIRLPAKNNEVIQINAIEKKGVRSLKKMNIKIYIGLLENERSLVRISSKLQSEKNIVESHFIKSFEEVLKELLDKDGKNVAKRNDKLILLVNFDELNNKERSSFFTNRRFERPTIEGFGQFNNTQVNNIPIFPISKESAITWGNWLLEKEINEYIYINYYEEKRKDIAIKFSPDYDIYNELKDFELMMSYFKEQSIKKNQKSMEYWYLHAPVDLTMEGD